MAALLAVYITCKEKDEATMIATVLVTKKLVACANIFPITSIYVWKEKLENSDEYVVIAKTLERRYIEVEKVVLSINSYECPCIIAWKISHVNSQYKKWVKEMVASS